MVNPDDVGMAGCEWCFATFQNLIREYGTDLRAERVNRHGKPREMIDAVKEAKRIMEW